MSPDRSKSSETDEFWSELERELGERIEAFGLGEHLSGWDLPEAGRWFITFVTRSGVHFRRPARNTWVGAMFGGSFPSDKEVSYHISGKQLETVEDLATETAKLSRLRRLVKPDPGVRLRYRDEHGAARDLVMRFETNRAALLEALGRVSSGSG